MDFNKILKERHSVRKFKQTKKVDYRKIIEVIEAGNLTPLAGNISSLKFILIQNKEKIKALSVAAQQDFIEEVDYLIVICSDKKNLERSYYNRGAVYAKQQAGAAIENMLLKITELGLASCWVGAFSEDTVKRILKIPDNIDVEAMLPVGIELGKKRHQTKPALDKVLVFDEWENKYMTPRSITHSSKI